MVALEEQGSRLNIAFCPSIWRTVFLERGGSVPGRILEVPPTQEDVSNMSNRRVFTVVAVVKRGITTLWVVGKISSCLPELLLKGSPLERVLSLHHKG